MREGKLPGWKCAKCGCDNEIDVETCALCGQPRPDSESYADVLEEDEREWA